MSSTPSKCEDDVDLMNIVRDRTRIPHGQTLDNGSVGRFCLDSGSKCLSPGAEGGRCHQSNGPGIRIKAESSTEDGDLNLMKIVESRVRDAQIELHGKTGTKNRVSHEQDEMGRKSHGNWSHQVSAQRGKDQVLEYIEDPDHQSPSPDRGHHVLPKDPAAGEAILQAGTPELRRQSANPRGLVETQPGAYSGSFGEGYERLEKVQNCNQVLVSCTLQARENLDIPSDLAKAPKEGSYPASAKSTQRGLLLGAAGFAILLAMLVVIPLVVLPSKHSELETGNEPEAEPSVPNMTEATLRELEDVHSIQYQAYDWVSKDPNWGTFDDWRKQQRFAMMCLYFSVGSDGDAKFWFSPNHHTHECNWIRTFDACSGPGKDVVSFLKISNLRNTWSTKLRSVPLEVGFLSHLDGLEIYKVEGGLLEELFSLETLRHFPSIRELKIHSCQVSGSIPSTLGLLTSLKSLDLSGNDLTGSIPKELGKLPSLTIFNIAGNPGLEPIVPSEFCMEDRMLPWESLLADWCSSQEACC